MIKKYCDMHGIKIIKCKINNIINCKGKNCQSLLLHRGKKIPNEYPKMVHTVSNLFKVKMLATKENPPTLKLNTFVATISKIFTT